MIIEERIGGLVETHLPMRLHAERRKKRCSSDFEILVLRAMFSSLSCGRDWFGVQGLVIQLGYPFIAGLLDQAMACMLQADHHDTYVLGTQCTETDRVFISMALAVG